MVLWCRSYISRKWATRLLSGGKHWTRPGRTVHAQNVNHFRRHRLPIRSRYSSGRPSDYTTYTCIAVCLSVLMSVVVGVVTPLRIIVTDNWWNASAGLTLYSHLPHLDTLDFLLTFPIYSNPLNNVMLSLFDFGADMTS